MRSTGTSTYPKSFCIAYCRIFWLDSKWRRIGTFRYLIHSTFTCVPVLIHCPHLKVASYMIVSQLSSRTGFSSKLHSALLGSIAKHAREGTYHDALLCIVYMFQTQDIKRLPSRAKKYLIQFPYVISFPSKTQCLIESYADHWCCFSLTLHNITMWRTSCQY